ncbi:hypothetical protein JQ600_23745 [Bradyrhizobium sp. AUGA SZCCT0176]|uniref:hypothetical protein n=1 Tax=Bradyrhizobium sp. AUGA SZCCT0176 TaxID=2807664 RepID=UPI001BA732B5|nr:hypothetical protein [Bradyrhizobium sp. AUGA SZCCT0176]MBR1227934.1 hypothetical protein [Bradyrhizobium sp. AUGA SZCCT0176]
MVSKSIDLNNGLQFHSISTGKAYFEKILNDTPLGVEVAGSDLQDLNSLYELYCKKTDWSLSSQPVAFFPMHEKGKGYTTKCFGVRFEDGSTNRFSLDKALSAVAM